MTFVIKRTIQVHIAFVSLLSVRLAVLCHTYVIREDGGSGQVKRTSKKPTHTSYAKRNDLLSSTKATTLVHGYGT